MDWRVEETAIISCRGGSLCSKEASVYAKFPHSQMSTANPSFEYTVMKVIWPGFGVLDLSLCTLLPHSP